MTNEEKINFFVKCQDLLIKYHPESDFIFRQSNVRDRLNGALGLCNQYKGFAYENENLCVLYNKIHIADETQPAVTILQNNMFREPHPDYNGMSIDFVVFRELQDCLNFCQTYYEPRIAHILFVKNNQPKIYQTEKLLSRVLAAPMVS